MNKSSLTQYKLVKGVLIWWCDRKHATIKVNGCYLTITLKEQIDGVEDTYKVRIVEFLYYLLKDCKAQLNLDYNKYIQFIHFEMTYNEIKIIIPVVQNLLQVIEG